MREERATLSELTKFMGMGYSKKRWQRDIATAVAADKAKGIPAWGPNVPYYAQYNKDLARQKRLDAKVKLLEAKGLSDLDILLELEKER